MRYGPEDGALAMIDMLSMLYMIIDYDGYALTYFTRTTNVMISKHAFHMRL